MRSAARPRRRSPPPLAAALLVALGAAAAAGPALGAEQAPSEYAVKAAFLRSALRLVDWPGARPDPVAICVLGEDPFGAALDAIAGKAGDLTVEVRRPPTAREARSCQVVFVSRSERARLRAALAALEGAGVLTVGDTEGYGEQGVALNFYLDGSKVRFEVNVEAARRAGVALQARLVSLGRPVRGP